jgi:hypothetical protein
MTTLFCSPLSSLPSPLRQKVVETPPTGNDAPEARSTEADGADPLPSPADDVTITMAGAVSGQLAPSTQATPLPAVGSMAIATPALLAPSTCTPSPPTAKAVVMKPLRLAFRDPAITRSHV